MTERKQDSKKAREHSAAEEMELTGERGTKKKIENDAIIDAIE